MLAATVQWGLSSGRLGHGKKVGVVVSDQAGDQAALNSYLLPDLKKAGITPQVATVAGNPDETATTNSDAQLAVERFKAAGVQSVFPLIPENAFFPYLAAENSQQYFPQLLLSDYESTIEVALGLIPVPYETGAQRAGGRDDRDARRLRRRPAREPGRLRPGRALVLHDVARVPPEAHPGHARATTSRSRVRFRPGAGPSGSSRRRPRTPART